MQFSTESTPLRGPYPKEELYRLRVQDPDSALRTYLRGLTGELGPVPEVMDQMAEQALIQLATAAARLCRWRRRVRDYGGGRHRN